MPIIAYQSFNSNSSSIHGLASVTNQRFTRETNKRVTALGHQALVLPFDTSDLTTPIQGPAELKLIEILATPQTVDVFGSQVALAWQNFYRHFGSMPDIMVCGELDTSHADFASMISDSTVQLTALPAKRACQSFTAVSQTALASQIIRLLHDEGFVAYSISGMTVVFVHVPNRIASSRSGTEDFYFKIAHSLNAKGAIVDLVIGDTNQGSFNTTADVLNVALKTNTYKNSISTASVVKIDNYDVIEKGTNSNASKMYDVAVYRSDTVEMKDSVAYISQSSSSVTATDHCGLAIRVEKK